MLWILVKKQLNEAFRSMFYDEKKNRMRPKWATAGLIFLIFLLTVPLLGGMFTLLALSLCGPLTEQGVGWMYFLLTGIFSVFLGTLGSVFTTYSGLYLARDNDLLLSLPIPVRTIMGARILSVYITSAAYSLLMMLPTLAVYWLSVPVTGMTVFCGIMFYLIVTLIVLMLSCLLGWAVARISLRLRNKSFVTVAASLAFLGLYYSFYFRAGEMLNELLLNAVVYGDRIKGAAYALYLFGRIGEGDLKALAAVAAVTLACGLVLWRLLSSSFIAIATSSGTVVNVRYVEKAAGQRSPFGALLGKEIGRFASSSTYMLNCGLGIVIIPLAGIAMLVKSRDILAVLGLVTAGFPGSAAVLACSLLFMVSSMNNMAVPSVSLEGKSIWIPQSLPVPPRTVLRAKLSLQLIFTGIPVAFSSVCAAIAVSAGAASGAAVCVFCLSAAAFSALGGMYLALRMPVLTWTSEVAPIKQSAGALISIFGTWIAAIAVAAGYFLGGHVLGAAAYLLIWSAVFAVASALLLRWLDTKGSRIFSEL